MGSIHDYYPPPPAMQTLSPNASVDDIVAALAIAGGCIVKDFVSLDIIKTLGNDFGPLLDAETDRWEGI